MDDPKGIAATTDQRKAHASAAGVLRSLRDRSAAWLFRGYRAWSAQLPAAVAGMASPSFNLSGRAALISITDATGLMLSMNLLSGPRSQISIWERACRAQFPLRAFLPSTGGTGAAMEIASAIVFPNGNLGTRHFNAFRSSAHKMPVGIGASDEICFSTQVGSKRKKLLFAAEGRWNAWHVYDPPVLQEDGHWIYSCCENVGSKNRRDL